jgi:hypothetical protein
LVFWETKGIYNLFPAFSLQKSEQITAGRALGLTALAVGKLTFHMPDK